MKTYTNPNQILRARQAWEYLGISKTKFYRLIQENKIRKGIPIAGRAVGWRLSDIEGYIASCEKKAAVVPLISDNILLSGRRFG